MGQSQSSADNGNDEAPQDNAVKQDYYELLGVERTASEDEIKKAYRRKALELHPDRNYGNVEETTKLFAEVQSAYEVLADPQERAWYDSHRDVLLRGEGPMGQDGEEYSYNVKMTTADDVVKLMLKFNGRLDYSDAPSGFYGGLNEFFHKLTREEDIACQWEDEDPLDYPSFGTKEDDYDEIVRPFYAAWTGFATRKSYSWKDQYRLSEAPDRRIRRLMEKENKKLREEAVQEFNDAVRSLVAFLRKRDPRVRNNQKSEAERQRALRDAAAAQAARARAAQQAKNEELKDYVVPEWARSRTKDEDTDVFSTESDEVEEHQYDCVVCDKTFKSEGQYKAHEKSKKHIKQLKQLQREMRAEGKELRLEGKHTFNGVEPIDDGGTDVDEAEETRASSPSVKQHKKERQDISQVPTESEDEENQQWLPTAKSSNANKSAHQAKAATATTVDYDSVSTDSRDNEEDDDDDDDADSNSDYASRAKIESRLTGSGKQDEKLSSTLKRTGLGDDFDEQQSAAQHGASQDTDTGSGSKSNSKLGKAKQKRAKKAAAAAAAVGTNAKGNKYDGNGGDPAGEFSCAVCGGQFASKTKLFNHVREENHAAPISQVKGSGAGRGSKGKKR